MFYKGNTYWENRKVHGKHKAIESPNVLWEHACDYFSLCDSTPWIKIDFKGKDAVKCEMPTQRPYTWTGFECYLKEKHIISKLDDYKENKDNRYSDYADIIAHISKIIYTQKLEGAIVGAYNANIIARDLGLADKQELTRTKIVVKPKNAND